MDGCSVFYKTWFEKDVYLIQDLLDAGGKVMSYAKFTEKYFLSCTFMTYFQVISAIPKNFIESAKVTSLEKTDFLSKNVFPLSSEVCVNLLKMKNKDFYKLLISKADKIRLKASTKWARDLQVDHIPLESYFGDMKTICKDNKLREFYFKLLHRTIVTKKEPSLWKRRQYAMYILSNERFNNLHFPKLLLYKTFFLSSYQVVQLRTCHLSKLLPDRDNVW